MSDFHRLKQEKKKKKTYTLTQEQIDNIKKECTEKAVNQAMVLLLTLPLEVLMDHYWQENYAEMVPEFTDLVLEYYSKWENGELEMGKLLDDLWEFGGVKLVLN